MKKQTIVEHEDNLTRDIIRRLERIERSQIVLLNDFNYLRESIGLQLGKYDQNTNGSVLSEYVSIKPDDDFIGQNWYPPESSVAGSFRWAGPGLLSTIQLTLRRTRQAILHLRVGGFLPSVQPTLRFFIDGETNFSSERTSQGWKLVIPPTDRPRLATEFAVLSQSVAQPSPENSEERDNRWLSFQFLGLDVFPEED